MNSLQSDLRVHVPTWVYRRLLLQEIIDCLQRVEHQDALAANLDVNYIGSYTWNIDTRKFEKYRRDLTYQFPCTTYRMLSIQSLLENWEGCPGMVAYLAQADTAALRVAISWHRPGSREECSTLWLGCPFECGGRGQRRFLFRLDRGLYVCVFGSRMKRITACAWARTGCMGHYIRRHHCWSPSGEFRALWHRSIRPRVEAFASCSWLSAIVRDELNNCLRLIARVLLHNSQRGMSVVCDPQWRLICKTPPGKRVLIPWNFSKVNGTFNHLLLVQSRRLDVGHGEENSSQTPIGYEHAYRNEVTTCDWIE